MNFELKFHSELLSGEKFLWTGQPDPNIFFTKGDIFLIPFSLLWGGSFISTLGSSFPMNGEFSIFSLVSVVFSVVGAYMIFGRFIYKYLKKKNTYYAVTSERVLILTELFGRSVLSINAKSLSAINKTGNGNGIGSILFGEQNQQSSMTGNMGMDLLGYANSQAFFDIHNVDDVYGKINRLKNAI